MSIPNKSFQVERYEIPKLTTKGELRKRWYGYNYNSHNCVANSFHKPPLEECLLACERSSKFRRVTSDVGGFLLSLTVYYENKRMTLFEQTRFRFNCADYTLLKINSIVSKICISPQILEWITFDCNSHKDKWDSPVKLDNIALL